MDHYEFEEGQRWQLRTTVPEFEDTLTIVGIARLGLVSQVFGAVPELLKQSDLYCVQVRYAKDCKLSPENDAVYLCLAAEGLARSVTSLMRTEALESTVTGGMRCDAVEAGLRSLLAIELQREEGRSLRQASIQPADLPRRFAAWRERHARPAWKPVTTEGDGSLRASKFAGRPWMQIGEALPLCEACGEPMALLLQIDLDALPTEIAGRFGSGLLQLFHCAAALNGTCFAATFEPFGAGQQARIIQPDKDDPPVAPPLSPYPPKLITSWERFTDYPSGEEHEALGLNYDYDFGKRLVTVTWAAGGVHLENLGEEAAEAIASAADGDKLGGWPAWVQGVEYPSCPRCGTRMELVFQLDSEDHLPVMFGDVGTGHVTQCPTHRDVVAFGWACS